MTFEDYLGIGETVAIGAHTFEADEIKAFAAKYDPQPFHLDEAAAERSVFRRLCASGWHTACTWMKYNMKTRVDQGAPRWTGEGPAPVFGPSPGFTDLKWPKPVYVGETVTFSRRPLSVRRREAKPGWHIMSLLAEGHDSAGDKVIEFTSGVLIHKP
ncbi:MAG: MaoC/PaaZ C-terminal domain-containing protein [Rhizobiaceae bacterium]